MTINGVKQKMLGFVASYYGEGHVFMAGAKMARRVEPYVTIQCTGFQRGSTSISTIDDDEYEKRHTRTDCTFQIDLYTKGRNLANGSEYAEYENTALDNLLNFSDYVDSDYGIETQSKYGMTMQLDGEVQDTSALVNESTYQYRATARYSVVFWDEAHGYFGQNNVFNLPNDSDGGDPYMITMPYVIEAAEINWRNKE